MVGPECGLAPIPDLSSEGIAVDTVKMWTVTNSNKNIRVDEYGKTTKTNYI